MFHSVASIMYASPGWSEYMLTRDRDWLKIDCFLLLSQIPIMSWEGFFRGNTAAGTIFMLEHMDSFSLWQMKKNLIPHFLYKNMY